MKAKKGFTLVEILIVVVILGILAAIVIPQFTDASTQAKEANMKSTLQSVRSQIELYKIQHNDEFPGQGTGGASFAACLTGYTDVDGTTVASTASGAFGPYLQAMPTNPWNNLATVVEVETDPNETGGDDSTGWFFNTVKGSFGANDSGATEDGVKHSSM